jgi:hypothetical protein
MKTHSLNVLFGVSLFFLAAMAVAQQKTGLGEDSNDQWQNGEVGYKPGCSLSASLGINIVCGELPSGKQAQKSQNAADASAAIAAIQKLQKDAGDVSTSSSQALQNLENQDSQDSADTSAAVAAFQKLKQAADKLVAATPDVFTIAQPFTAESSSDKVSAYTFPQRVLAWGVEGIPGQDTQNTPPVESFPDNSASEDKSASKDNQDGQEKMNQYSQAQQQYQQALQDLSNTLQNASKNTTTNLKQPQGAQIERGSQKQGQQIPDCIAHHYACNK